MLQYLVLFQNEMAYNPRLLVFDLKGSLGSYTTAEDVNLQELQQNVNWDGKSEVYASQGIAKNTFLKELDSSGIELLFEAAHITKERDTQLASNRHFTVLVL